MKTLHKVLGAGSFGVSAILFYGAAEIHHLSVGLRTLFPRESDTFAVGVAVTLGFLFALVGCDLLFRRSTER
jgi:hypothetical protein